MEIEITAAEALQSLLDNGFNIKPTDGNKYLVIDNGMFGFLEDEDAFIVDEEELIEIYEMYVL